MKFSVGSKPAAGQPSSYRPMTLGQARLERINNPPNIVLLRTQKQRAALSYPTDVLTTLIPRLEIRVRELRGLTEHPHEATTGESWLHAMSRLDEAEATLAACLREAQKRASTSDGNTASGAGCAGGSNATRATPSGEQGMRSGSNGEQP